jgi:hypothetical protein
MGWRRSPPDGRRGRGVSKRTVYAPCWGFESTAHGFTGGRSGIFLFGSIRPLIKGQIQMPKQFCRFWSSTVLTVFLSMSESHAECSSLAARLTSIEDKVANHFGLSVEQAKNVAGAIMNNYPTAVHGITLDGDNRKRGVWYRSADGREVSLTRKQLMELVDLACE